MKIDKTFSNAADNFKDCIAFLEAQFDPQGVNYPKIPLSLEKQIRKSNQCTFYCSSHHSQMFASTTLTDKLIIALNVTGNDLLVSIYTALFPDVADVETPVCPPIWQILTTTLVVPSLFLYQTCQNIRGSSYNRQIANEIITSISDFLSKCNS